MENLKTVWSKTNRWHRGVVIFLIIELKVLPAGQSGFTCNDPALSHTFYGDTVTWKHLFGTVLLLPLAVMLVIERLYHKESSKPRKQALKWYKEYIFGFLLNLIIVQGVKMVIGAPRPHFFDTCSPVEATTCQGSEFVPRYTCSKTQFFASESGKSFPSGHTALAAHAGLFLVYYLYRRASKTSVIYLSQGILMLLTVYCGISRMWDHRHHPRDVLAGAVVGVATMLYTILLLCRNFDVSLKEATCEPSNSDLSSNVPLTDSELNLEGK